MLESAALFYGEDHGRVRHSGRFHSLRRHAARRRAVPSLCVAGRPDRAGRHFQLQDSLHRLQDRRRSRRLRFAHGARMGAAGEFVLPAGRLRPAGAPFRRQRRTRGAAEAASRRLARPLRAAHPHLFPVQLPRQHRGGVDWRHDGGQSVQAQGAHRLSRRHCCGLECRRVRLGGRRHHHDHDVDRRG